MAALAIAPVSPVVVTKPAAESSWAQAFIARAKAELASAPPTSLDSYARAGAAMLGEYAEAGGVGALLGTAHAKHGLDSSRGPVDGWISATAAVASVCLSGVAPELALHVRHVGAEAFAVLAFRKSYELVAGEPLPGAVTNGVRHIPVPGRGPGVQREDPIEVAARSLG